MSLKDLLALLGDVKADTERQRQEAIACYLSVGEGWSEAMQRLDGAFAAEAGGLRESKTD